MSKTDQKINKRSVGENIHLFNLLNNETKNLEDCTIVWLDTHFRARPHHIAKLRNIVNYLQIFDDADNCMQYVSGIEQERIFLIISGQTGKHIVPLLHHLPQVYSIYVFCTNKELHQTWSTKYSKIRGVFVDENLLYDHLNKDAWLCSSQMPISIIPFEQTSHSLSSNEKPSFLWSHILLQVLLRLPTSNNAKLDMINQARNQYENNLIEQARIDDFERTYSSDAALKWYTRDSFVYRLVNKALRTENIDNIFLYRFFINDLYKELSRMYPDYISNAKSSILTFYRGQLMSTSEFEKIKSSVNQYISINTFLSTSKSSEVAISFFTGSSLRPVAECVLFEISVDISVQTQPFADIHKRSVNQDEEEVLFTMGTIFKIESCEQFNEDFWHITLSLSNEQDERIKTLLDYYHTLIGETSSLLILGEFLHKTHELDKAERYYQLLTRKLPEGHIDIGMALNNIGSIYTDRGQYKTAKTYLRKALRVYKKTLPECHLNIAEIYLNLGSVFSRMDSAKTALKYEKKGLNIQMQLLPVSHLTLATTYNNIGDTYVSLHKNKKALKYFQQALQIELQHLPNNHCDIAVTYNNLASVYIDMHDRINALEYLNKALDIRTTTLPPSHPDIADTYRLMGTVADETDQTTDALDKYNKSLQILLDRPLSNLDHHRISQIHTDLGLLYIKRRLPKLALKCFRKCLYHLKQCEFLDPYDTSIVYNNLATAYIDLEKYKKALICCHKSLKIQHICGNALNWATLFNTNTIRAEIFRAKKRFNKALHILKKVIKCPHLLLPESGVRLCTVYKEIGLIYADKTQFKAAAKYLKKSIKFYNLFSPGSKINVAFCYRQLGTSYASRNMSQEAIKWYKKAITTYSKAEPSPPIDLARTYHLLGEQFVAIKQYSKAKSSLIKARNLYISNLATNDALIAKTSTSLGQLEWFQKRFKVANKYYRLALNIYQQQKKSNYDNIINLNSLLGGSFFALHNVDKAMHHWHQALKIAVKNSLLSNGNEQLDIILGTVYCNIGQVYLNNDKLNRALKKLKKSLCILHRYSNPAYASELSRTLLFIGSVYRKKEYYKQALLYLRKAQHLLEKDSDQKQNELLPILYGELGLCYHHIGDLHHRKAYHFYKRANIAPSSCVAEDFYQAMKKNIKRLKKQYTATIEKTELHS